MFKNTLLTAVAFSVLSTVSHAAVLLNDNFDTENGGTPTLNYSNFKNFNVSAGSVDLIGNGYFDFYPGNGLYIDMCGTTNQCGALTTKQTFAAGNYEITINLGGNARLDVTDGVNVRFGGSSVNYELTEFQTETVTEWLTLSNPSTLTITDLGQTGNNDIGTNLFSVEVQNVPEPASLAILSIGLIGLGVFRRKRA
jgi:hypothetical protein